MTTRTLAIASIVFIARLAIASEVGPDIHDAPVTLPQFEKSLESLLLPGLQRNQSAISLDEYFFIKEFSLQNGVLDLVYLNKYGEVRWFSDPPLITKPYDQLLNVTHRPTKAIPDAFLKKVPIMEHDQESNSDYAAIPLISTGTLLGIVSFKTRLERIDPLIVFVKKFQRKLVYPNEPSTKEEYPITTSGPTEGRTKSQQRYLSGMIFFQKGDYLNARKEWAESVRLNPGNADAIEALKRLDRAETPPRE